MSKSESAPTKTTEEKKQPAPAVLSPQEELERGLTFISIANRSKEVTYVQRTIRTIPYLRRNVDASTLAKAISSVKPKDAQFVQLKALLEQSIDVESKQESMEVEESASGKPAEQPKINHEPETLLFLSILVFTNILDKKDYQKGQKLTSEVVATIKDFRSPVSDLIAARVYYYYSLFHEAVDQFDVIRPTLLSLLTFSTINFDHETQATVLNLLLRNYIRSKLYDQAQKLITRTTFPETASNAQLARYMYYVGLIKVLRLDYTEAHKYVEDCIRKVPVDEHTAGFQQAAVKLLVVIELLLGQIPKRSLFHQKYLKNALEPYFELTKAVRVGELSQFQKVVENYREVFEEDRLHTLILRLHHNVIRAGIRSISQAYSVISFKDISIKLDLSSEEDAQYIVAKAIRDGVIDATINYKENYVQTNENLDVYSTSQPQEAFDQRIKFCLKLHADSVKAMRFPEDENAEALASAAEAREHEAKLAKDLIEDDGLSDLDDEPEF